MELPEITSKLLAAKKVKRLTFADIGKALGHDESWVAALFYRQAKATEEETCKLAKLLELPCEDLKILADFPTKGLGPVVPTDPLIYRLYEFIQVYGMPIKAVVHEKFGDGIMSLIDFTVHVDKEQDPKGDRVKITMSGKFLPYKVW
ncbi:MAG: cyanase [Terriglobales bacterium]